MKKLSILFVLFIGFINAQKFSKSEIELINQGNINTALPIYQTTDDHQHKIGRAHV